MKLPIEPKKNTSPGGFFIRDVRPHASFLGYRRLIQDVHGGQKHARCGCKIFSIHQQKSGTQDSLCRRFLFK